MRAWTAGVGALLIGLVLVASAGCGGSPPTPDTTSRPTSTGLTVPLAHGVLTVGQPELRIVLPPGTQVRVILLNVTSLINPELQEVALTLALEDSGPPSRSTLLGVVSPYPLDAASSYSFGLDAATRETMRKGGGTLVVAAKGSPEPLRSSVRIVLDAAALTD